MFDSFNTRINAFGQLIRDFVTGNGKICNLRHISINHKFWGKVAHLDTPGLLSLCPMRFFIAAFTCPVMSPISSPKKFAGQFRILPNKSIWRGSKLAGNLVMSAK